MKKKGFTLIELIAVIAILAILAIIAVPRVMTYVDRSKKVAVQTEASTIYNAAEAAYNDGKFTTANGNNEGVALKREHFENIYVKDVANFLKEEGLLSNVNMDKFKNFQPERGDKDLSKLGLGKGNSQLKNYLTIADLKKIMNAKTDDINVDSQGVLQEIPGTKSTTGQQTKSTTGQQ